jgi:hypothetical protein
MATKLAGVRFITLRTATSAVDRRSPWQERKEEQAAEEGRNPKKVFR